MTASWRVSATSSSACIWGGRVVALSLALAVTLAAGPALAATTTAKGPMIAGIPIDFILFGLTLLGVALLHHHTLYVALAGLTAITS